MDNTKRPKVQNMNDIVNGTGDSIANTQTVKTPVTNANIRTNNTAGQRSADTERPVRTNTNTSSNANTATSGQRRSAHVSTGMRSAARSSQNSGRPASSGMQTVQLGQNAKQSSSTQPRREQARTQQIRRVQPQGHEQRVADSTPMRKGESGSRRYSDIREEKRVKQQKQNGSRRSSGGKKKMGKWGKFLIILSAALLVILIVGCIIFSSFLGSYEKGQHSNIAASVVEEFSSKSSLTSYLNKNKDKIHCLEDFDSLVSGYADSLEARDFICL
jgi:hypothetical protein